MPHYKCGICGKEHDELPRDLAYIRPADYFEIPESERAERIKLNSDLCVIDDSRFYIRGVLSLPIIDTNEEFRWGVWAKVGQTDYERYYELWDSDDASNEPPFSGYLSGSVGSYVDSDMLEVTIQLQAGNQRPRFYVVSEENALGIDQRNGITEQQAHAFAALLLK